MLLSCCAAIAPVAPCCLLARDSQPAEPGEHHHLGVRQARVALHLPAAHTLSGWSRRPGIEQCKAQHTIPISSKNPGQRPNCGISSNCSCAGWEGSRAAHLAGRSKSLLDLGPDLRFAVLHEDGRRRVALRHLLLPLCAAGRSRWGHTAIPEAGVCSCRSRI